MRIVYSFLTRISILFIWISQFFSEKMKLFVRGRKNGIERLRKQIDLADKTIWFHCASLGEFEQGLPIMEAIKQLLPEYKLVVTFFSPSGYENKKNAAVADVIGYLPMDTGSNARKFLKVVHPSLAVFVKYEFWPNYLLHLKKKNVPTLLISGLFRPNQSFFKWHGGFMRRSLRSFDHFFVQDMPSLDLLKGIGLENVTLSGDTRFDRVSHQIEQDNSLDFMDVFKGNSLCIVCGSTWPEDEAALLPFLNSDTPVKFVLAPHKIDASNIREFRKKLKKESVLFSEKEGEDLSRFPILIIDNIGLLSRIYSYADIAYVGGAMGRTGLHNILEPATFGVPVVIGRNYEKFPEAIRLRQLAGLFSVSNPEACTSLLSKLTSDHSFRNKTGMIAGHFVNSNTGATQKIMDHIDKLDRNGLI